MEAAEKMNYPIIPVINDRWIIERGFCILEMAQGLKNRVRWYFEHCLGLPWREIRFDSEYFAVKMREARARQQEVLERKRYIVPNRERIETIASEIEEKDFTVLNDLFEQGNGMGISKDLLLAFYSRPEYSYERHRKAIMESLGYEERNFNDLPQAVVQDTKLNRIFNFITIIFLQHYGQIKIRQAPPDMDIWVSKSDYLNLSKETWD